MTTTTTETEARGPHIASLKGVTVGDNPTAKLILRVLQGLEARGATVQEALTTVAARCLCDEWTVYRWLRGQREPASPKTVAALNAYAVDLGVEAA